MSALSGAEQRAPQHGQGGFAPSARGALRTWWSTLATNLLVLSGSVASAALAARLLLPEGRGALAVLQFWPHIIAGVAGWSVNEALAARASRFPEESDGLRRVGLWLALGCSASAFLVSLPLLPWLLGAERRELIPDATVYLAVLLPASLVSTNLLGVEMGHRELRRFNRLRALQPVSYLSSLTAIWAWGAASVRAVAAANLVSVAAVALTRGMACGRSVLVAPSCPSICEVWRVAWRFHLVNLAGFASQQVDLGIVIGVCANRDVGYWVAGQSLLNASVGAVVQAFQIVALPSFSRESRQNDGKAIVRLGRLAIAALVFGGVGIAVALPVVIPIIFGQAFRAAIPVALLMTAASVPRGVRGVLGYAMRGEERTTPLVYSEVVATVLSVLLGLPAAGKWGIAGIAGAAGIAQSVALLVLMCGESKSRGLPLSDWLPTVGRLRAEYQGLRGGASPRADDLIGPK